MPCANKKRKKEKELKITGKYRDENIAVDSIKVHIHCLKVTEWDRYPRKSGKKQRWKRRGKRNK